MMSRILIIFIAAALLIGGQNFLSVPGVSNADPILACLLTLIIAPWLYRQFE